MKVKKAIETLKDYIKCASDNWSVTISDNDAVKFNDIITLLQQGEKYRQMWEEAVAEGETNVYNWVTKEYYKNKLKEIEQKYFPKEITKDIESSGHFFVDEYLKEAKVDDC